MLNSSDTVKITMKSRKKVLLKKIRKLSIFILGVLGLVAGWFIVNRAVSPFNRVKMIELQIAQNESLTPAKETDALRIGCYNIAHGRGGVLGTNNWSGGNRAARLERLKKIAQLLKDANLDIVVLNEVDFSSFWSGHIDQAQIIASEAGYPYIVEQRNIDVAIPFMSIRFGNVILSKLPLSEPTFINFPHPSRLQEILVGGFKDGVVATATLPNGEHIQVAAVHLSLEGEAYRHESVKMYMNVQETTRLPMIAMGDFNSTANGYPGHHTDTNGHNCIDLLLGSKQWSTIPTGLPVNSGDFTFPSQEPARVIDWIFVASPWSLHEKTILQSDLSDHLPLTATLQKTPNNESDDRIP